ncbi:MAG: hypothetical protein K2N60_09740 [Oscillospiraceae bacterium]|nr:hypothetical protein [Oscillospiraceae bacterium]
MEMKVGHIQIRSSFSGGKGINVSKSADTNSAKAQRTNVDTFAMSSPSEPYSSLSKETMEQLRRFSENTKNCKIIEPLTPDRAEEGYNFQVKFNFAVIGSFEKRINENISKKLEEAGVPKDTTFEFDYNFDSRETVITNISNEEYRENIESVLKDTDNMFILAYGSRVMNGYISSIFYPRTADSLKECFEQDISDLYIDEKGNLCGANKNLQDALDTIKKAEKKGEHISAYYEFEFPANDIEGLLKRLISDENITPNISRMGYDGERIYTNDGEFRFGKDFDLDLFGDQNLFDEEKYLMRGRMACYLTSHGCENLWLKNYDKFY